jgi:hypothetical protein
MEDLCAGYVTAFEDVFGDPPFLSACSEDFVMDCSSKMQIAVAKLIGDWKLLIALFSDVDVESYITHHNAWSPIKMLNAYNFCYRAYTKIKQTIKRV